MDPKTKLGKWLVKHAGDLRKVIAAYIVAVSLGSTIFYFIELRERGYTIWQALYWGQVTGTTTGYGDIHPVSGWGMLLSVVYLFVVSMFLLAVLIANLVSKLMPNPHLFEDGEQEEMKARLRKVEANQEEIKATQIWTSEVLRHIATAVSADIPAQPVNTKLQDQ